MSIVKILDKEIRVFNAWTKRKGVPFHINPPHIWAWMFRDPGFPLCGRFHKRTEGCYNPRRWGGRILGFEFGCRG